MISTDNSCQAAAATGHRRFRVIGTTALAAVGTLATALAGFLTAGAIAADARPASPAVPQGTDERPVTGIKHAGPIQVVFHVSEDETKGGVGKALFYLRKIHDGYLAAGVDPDRIQMHAVYHGSAAEHLLTDAAWNRQRGETAGNPNTELIAELARRGVSIELCNNRRIENGWSKSDVHPDVRLVSGAYHRIIDLQLRGYAYIQF